jgi:hypothetical protein
MRLLALGAASVVALVVAVASPAADRMMLGHACPFCGSVQGQTLVKEVQSVKFVVYGTASNARRNVDADGREITSTDLTIEDIIKDDPVLKGKKKLTLPRYIHLPPGGTEKVIVLGDVVNDQPDAYLSIVSKDGALAKYLKEAISVDENDIPKRLRFYFNYLDHYDTEISGDAFKEFAKAEYSDVVKMVQKHGEASMRKRLLDWFKSPDTPQYRYGLIGLMLGLFGDKSDSDAFLSLLNDPEKNVVTGADGVMAGYILVDKENGWKYTKKVVLTLPNDFQKRYAGLRTIRFLYDTHIGHIPVEELVDTIGACLDQEDMADLVIEDLRRWKQWKFTDKIIALRDKDSQTHFKIMRAAILKYALTCPLDKHPVAKAYVDEMKKTQPEKVRDALEIIELEKSTATPTEAEARNAK